MHDRLLACFLAYFLAVSVFAEIVKVNEALYYTKISEDLYLVFEFAKTRPNFWQNYFEVQSSQANEFMMSEEEALKKKSAFFYGALDPFLRCRNMLFKYRMNYYKNSAMGIAYAVNILPTEKIENELKTKNFKPDEIEMSMCVISKPEAPFQVHMGISRGINHYAKYLKNESTIYHPNLSLLLHAFSAKVIIEQIDKNKSYMITTPLQSMREILEKQLPKNSYWVGSHNESPIRQEGEVGSTNDTLRSARLSNGFKFTLTKNDEIIFQVDEKSAKNDHMWFFDNVQPSSSYPYFIIDLKELAKTLPN